MTTGLMRRGWCCVLGVVGLLAPAAMGQKATSAEDLDTLPDFKVESVLTADGKVNGSWISMAKDPKGRLLLAGQRGQPITRVTIENGKVARQEQLHLPISEAMGMLFAFDSFYVNGADTKGHFGLFRLKDSQGDGNYDKIEMLREWHGGAGEHGAHGIVVGPDKKLYTVCGNFVDVPKDISPNSPHRNYADDRVLPRAEDGNGFGAGKKPPGGFVCRMDPDGKNAELFCSGERNTYDIAMNADGELLAFDSDMEWDWGTPWYRPIRIFHGISGGDQGFREGSAKWPEYYFDSLPAAVNVGIGSPTGLVFGYGAKFPAKYQKAFFVLDWSYGRLIAAHLTPKGATYTATWENFVAPKGLKGNGRKESLNLTDVVIGNDGGLYFTIGGRGTQACLYRVSYTGSESTSPVDPHDKDGAEARALRHQLEAFDGKQDPKAVEFAWKHLNDEDRWIRYAARIAIESQPVAEWQGKALEEQQPEAALTALLALARLGRQETQGELMGALKRVSSGSTLTEPQTLEALRVIEVSIARQGKPTGDLAEGIVAELDPLYPAKTPEMNRELCELLLALGAPDAVAKTVKLLETASTQEEQVGYAMALRTIKDGWTPELRRAYFSWFTQKQGTAHHPDYVVKWFTDAGRDYSDGASYPQFISHMHADAQKTLTEKERQTLEPVLAAYTPPGQKPRKPMKPRNIVKEWEMADIEPALPSVSSGRDFNKGREAFEVGQCLACHRFGNEGGSVGPELTAIASRYSRKDILESILDPSKVVSEQYQNTMFQLKSGDVIEGRVLQENDNELVVRPNALAPDTVNVKKADIKMRAPSKLSPMPKGLVDTLSKEEVLDLIAYLESAGRKDHPDFKK